MVKKSFILFFIVLFAFFGALAQSKLSGNKGVTKLLCRKWILETSVIDGVANPKIDPKKADRFTMKKDMTFVNECPNCDNIQRGKWELESKNKINLIFNNSNDIVHLQIMKLQEDRMELKILDQSAETIIYFNAATPSTK